MTDAAHREPSGSDGTAAEGTSAPPASEERSPLAQVCDIVRYVPIALLLDGPSLLPELAERGKAHVRNAQVLGKLAVREGETRLRQQLDDLGPRVVDLLRLFGLAPEAPPDDPTDAPAAPMAPAADVEVVPEEVEAPAEAAAPTVDELAIPDYESLSASQVVNRLPGLAGDELEAVRRYETVHRGRKTILNKVAQLQTPS
jgi:hypothetical protein